MAVRRMIRRKALETWHITVPDHTHLVVFALGTCGPGSASIQVRHHYDGLESYAYTAIKSIARKAWYHVKRFRGVRQEIE
jgi:hypothetical protein